MDIASAMATIAALSELTTTVVNGKIDAEVKTAAADLNNSILSLQGTLFSLQSENHELQKSVHTMEKQLANLANWENTTSQYELKELSSGVFVYCLKDDQCNIQPMHFICPSCFQEQRKSILTCTGRTFSGRHYVCQSPSCKAEFTNHNDKENIHI